jgi:c(7)-type cytochrome triheme protein
MNLGHMVLAAVTLPVCIALSAGIVFAQGLLNLPPHPAADSYGDVLIDRTSRAKHVLPVPFSHWVHRVKYTCRVCHYELEFSLKTNDTSIVCDEGRMGGRYCAACHDGKAAFGPKDEEGENCGRCHSRNGSPSWKKFLDLKERLPATKFGNEIDWSKALDKGLIAPQDSLSGEARSVVHMKVFTLKAEWSGIPYAIFPHKTHEQWLDCSSCHPELFNIKRKTTQSLRMANMVRGESCAVCHLRVAFPLDDCRRCHPSMRGSR